MSDSRKARPDRARVSVAVWAFVVGAALSMLLMAVWAFDREPASSAPANDPKRLAELETRLAREIRTRETLTARIGELDAELATLRSLIDQVASSATPESTASPEPDGTDTSPEAEAAKTDAAGFDRGRLADVGVDPREIDRLQEIWETNQMARVRLLNQALREGWFMEQRHQDELAALEAELHQELSEEELDRYLYAIGQPNRVQAQQVFSGSAASTAGIEPGDVILRYDDTRIFKPRDLLLATSSGRVGESVRVQVLRGDRRLTLYTERGPLGVMLRPVSQAPLETR
jgi:uncharacterized coiled-coil protein SlyX